MKKPRRRYLIDRQFQLKYVVLTICLLVMHTFLVLCAVFAPTFIMLYSSTSLEKKAEAANSILFLHNTIWPGIAVVIFLFGCLSIFVTHKLAGPLYRIKMSLREMAEGNFAVRIRLRKGDELGELAEEINLLAESVRKSQAEVRAINDGMKATVLALKDELAAEGRARGRAEELLGAIETGNAAIGSALKRYE